MMELLMVSIHRGIYMDIASGMFSDPPILRSLVPTLGRLTGVMTDLQTQEFHRKIFNQQTLHLINNDDMVAFGAHRLADDDATLDHLVAILPIYLNYLTLVPGTSMLVDRYTRLQQLLETMRTVHTNACRMAREDRANAFWAQ
jgi:hypothetical protein